MSALHLRQMLDLVIHEHLDLLGVDPEFLEDEVRNVLRLLQYSFEYMYRFDDLLAVHLGNVYCLLYGLLCFDCKFVECHIFVLLVYYLKENKACAYGEYAVKKSDYSDDLSVRLGFLGNHPFSTRFFCANSSPIPQRAEAPKTPRNDER